MKRDCTVGNGGGENDLVFATGGEYSTGWLIDNGTTSHMTPHRHDLFYYEGIASSIDMTADDKKLRVAGTRTARLTTQDGRRTKIVGALHIPGLDRSLLSAI